MLFKKKDGNVPKKVSDANLKNWYVSLKDTDRVRLGRYLDDAETSSPAAFLISVMLLANEDHNYEFAITAGNQALGMVTEQKDKFNVLEAIVPALFFREKYEECMSCCEEGISMLEDGSFRRTVCDSSGCLPDVINCRSFALNASVRALYDYDRGQKILDRLLESGIIDEEEYKFRKQSITIFKLQKTFDGIMAVRETED